MCPVTEHFILKSNVDPAQEDAHNLELKGKTLDGSVGRGLQGMINSRNKGEKRKQEEEKEEQGKTELQAKQQPSMHHPKYRRTV